MTGGQLGSGPGHARDAVAPESAGAGRTLGDYELVRPIGVGGVGEVWLAVQRALQRTVAVKILHAERQSTPEERERFLEEARFAARLQHPNIVTVLDYGHHAGRSYYVMQYVEGATLAAIVEALSRLVRLRDPAALLALPAEIQARFGIDAQGRRALIAAQREPDSDPSVANDLQEGPPRRNTLALAAELEETRASIQRKATHFLVESTIEVAQGLAYAHGTSIVHGDVKPSNLILDKFGRVRILDFGLAKLAGPGSDTRKALEGTPQYISPEQIAGTSEAFSPSIDVYALGALLYELLTLQPMYAPGPVAEVLRRIVTEAPPGPRELNPRIHRSLEAIVLKSTARTPRNRYASMEALADDLQRFLRHQPVAALKRRRRLSDLVEELRLSRMLQALGLLFVMGCLFAGWYAFEAARSAIELRSSRRAALAAAAGVLDEAESDWRAIPPADSGLAFLRPERLEWHVSELAGHAQRVRAQLAAFAGAELPADAARSVADIERRTWQLDTLRAALAGREMEFESCLADGRARSWNDAEVIAKLAELRLLGGLEIRLARIAQVSGTITWIDPQTLEAQRAPTAAGNLPIRAARLLSGEYLVRLRDEVGRELSFPVRASGGADLCLTLPLAPSDVPDGMCYVPSFRSEEHIVGDEVTRVGDLRSTLSSVGKRSRKLTGSFFIDRHEVTNSQLERFLASDQVYPLVAEACEEFEGSLDEALARWIAAPEPERWSFGNPDAGAEDLPACGVHAYLAEAYARWVGKGIPSEAQWEKAARGIDGRTFVYGNRFRPGLHAASERLPVGSRPGDVSVYGVSDMMASVPEWARSDSGQGHIVRGASHETARPGDLRLAARRPGVQVYGIIPCGLRLVAATPAPELGVERRER